MTDLGEHDLDDVLPREVLVDLARLVLADETTDSVLARVCDMTKKAVKGADEVSVTLERDGRAVTAAYTGELAMQADERQYGLDSGPCVDAGRGGELLHIRDVRTEDRWPDYTPLARDVGVCSSLSVPLPIQADVVGALNIYSRRVDAFDEEDRAAATAFASYAAIAVANASVFESTTALASQLQTAMASRAIIEQAKGVLMAQRRCGADQAFGLLVRASQRENVKLRELAQRVVGGVVDQAPG